MLDAYTIAYHNAHTDSANPDRWAAVAREARALRAKATDDDDRARWAVTVHTARVYWHVARHYGLDPLSADGREAAAARL